MSKKIDKKNGNKKIFIIVGVCLLILVLVVGSLLFVNKKSNKENDSWVNDYKDFIIEDIDLINKEKNEFTNNTKEISSLFIKSKDEDIPYLVYDRQSEYNGNVAHYKVIATYDYDNKVDGVVNLSDANDPEGNYRIVSYINYMYDVENKESDWYVVKNQYTKGELSLVTVTKVSKEVESAKNIKKLNNDMLAKYGEKYKDNEDYKNKLTEYYNELDRNSIKFFGNEADNYSNKMINLTDQLNLNVFKFTKDSSKNEINKAFDNGLEKYKESNKDFDKVVKKIIEKQNKIIDEAIEKIEEEKQENNTTEEETVNNNVNNNNNNTVQNNSDNGISVGGMIVKYGTYNGDAAEAGSTLVINRGGTCTYNGSACTYSVSRQDFGQDSSTAGSYEDCLSININGSSICYMPSNGGSRINNGGFEFYYVG